jgi:hypothetical protein
MRNIIFRAWDDLNKKWLMGYEYPSLGGFSFTGESVLFGEWGSCFDLFLFDREGRKPEHLIIEQHISLNDRNSKPIYEGDILSDGTRKFKVFAVNGGFAINTHQDDFNRDHIPFYESTADMQTSTFISGTLEVIGNIHEGEATS